MVVDTSALVALFLREPDHEDIADSIDEARLAFCSTVSKIEILAVLCGQRVGAEPDRVEAFIDGLGLSFEPVTIEQMDLAAHALLTYGKGRHPAALNLGDCFAYALAKSRGLPLLFKGDDFARTDIVPAWRP